MISRYKDIKSYVIYAKNITNILGWWYYQKCFLRCKFSHNEFPALLAKILQLFIVIKGTKNSLYQAEALRNQS